jgi:alpha-1,6-mannosyltransferase
VLAAVGLLSSALYVAFVLGTEGTLVAPALFPVRKEIIPGFLVHFLVLFALYLLAAWLVWRRAPDRPSITLTILLFAAGFRLILLWTPPVLSDDLYRYVWDGKVQTARINPYLYAPDAQELSHLRDDAIFPRINRPWARTIYPPGAQWLFLGIAAVRPDSVRFLKAAIAAVDMLTIVLLMWLLRATGVASGRAILYAWHPLPVFELAGSGHVDGLMLPFLLLSLLFFVFRREALSGALLGAAAAIKLYPALLLPALVRRSGPRLLMAAGATAALLYFPYVATAGRHVLGFLPQYLSDSGERFNPGPGGLLAYSLGSLVARPMQVAYGILAMALLLVLWRAGRRDEESLDAAVGELLLACGVFVTFAQTVHPWYLLWILPLLALRPEGCWIYLSGAIALSYVMYAKDDFRMPTWVVVLEYLPFYLLALWAILSRKRRPAGTSPVARPPGGGLS